jgi:hypothetical protein
VPKEDKGTAARYRVKNGNSAEARNQILKLQKEWAAQKNCREIGESIDFSVRHKIGLLCEFMETTSLYLTL